MQQARVQSKYDILSGKSAIGKSETYAEMYMSWQKCDVAKEQCCTFALVTTYTGRCNLCIAEKYIFLYRDDLGSLNSRDELTAKCMHMDG